MSQSSLISHGEAYFKRQDVQRAVNGACSTHGVEAVVRAIANYATILDSPVHRWSHRWPLKEFLKRGLDRFVDEADPLSQYSSFSGGRGLTADQIFAMAEEATELDEAASDEAHRSLGRGVPDG